MVHFITVYTHRYTLVERTFLKVKINKISKKKDLAKKSVVSNSAS